MSMKSVQKMPCQKKRKSCFEITRVAFQKHSDNDSDDDDDDSCCFHRKQRDCCDNCNSVLNGNSNENFKNCSQHTSARTRFKVLRTSCTKGRWSCSDSIENDETEFRSTVASSVGDFSECTSTHLVGNELSCASNASDKALPSSRNGEEVMADPSHSPDRFLLPSSSNCDFSIDLSNTSERLQNGVCNLDLVEFKPQTVKQSSSSPQESDLHPEVSVALKSHRAEICEYFDPVFEKNFHDRHSPHDASICTKRRDQISLETEQTVVRLHAQLRNDWTHPDKNVVLTNSSENISDKISKALDLAKEHVILTAHGEIERLKEKIAQLQSTIKQLEEENTQLRDSRSQSQLQEVSTTDDLIDLSDN